MIIIPLQKAACFTTTTTRTVLLSKQKPCDATLLGNPEHPRPTIGETVGDHEHVLQSESIPQRFLTCVFVTKQTPALTHFALLDFWSYPDRSRSGSNDQSVVSLSSFCLLYSEIIQYHQNRVDSLSELERRLEGTGYAVGLRVLELLAYRNRDYKRETRLMGVLQFVSTQVWKALFGKAADSLERSIDHADEFMIVDYSPITRYR